MLGLILLGLATYFKVRTCNSLLDIRLGHRVFHDLVFVQRADDHPTLHVPERALIDARRIDRLTISAGAITTEPFALEQTRDGFPRRADGGDSHQSVPQIVCRPKLGRHRAHRRRPLGRRDQVRRHAAGHQQTSSKRTQQRFSGARHRTDPGSEVRDGLATSRPRSSTFLPKRHRGVFIPKTGFRGEYIDIASSHYPILTCSVFHASWHTACIPLGQPIWRLPVWPFAAGIA
jgi:hypothetical protein